ncbi:DNA helicase [Clostridium aminobutyricum]|uniref:DNA helicase n=1 Tax=Clostridium aminobutyricum TaxID=33953 RepID=UPI001FD6B297|nr:DNA helicase [Clostridium aminobutyricum]
MINEIKTIVQNYINNEKLCKLTVGTVTSTGIKVSDKLTIPNVLIKGNLKDCVSAGDRVRLIRNHGGQEFYIVEIIGFTPVTKNRTVSIEPIMISNGMTLSSITIKDVIS